MSLDYQLMTFTEAKAASKVHETYYEIVVLPHDEDTTQGVEVFNVKDLNSALKRYEELRLLESCDPMLVVYRVQWKGFEQKITEYGLDALCIPYSKLPKYIKAVLLKEHPDLFEYLATHFNEIYE